MQSKSLKENSTLEATLSTTIYHHRLSYVPESSLSYTWEMENTSFFNELIVSWNAMRPQYGELRFTIALKIEGEWTSNFPYAIWGSEGQRGGHVAASPISIDQDILEVVDGKKASGFRVKVEACNGAQLGEFHSLHVCARMVKDFFPEGAIEESIEIPVPLISQMKLVHPKNNEMCSAASTASAVSYLVKKNRIDPVCFALQSQDEAFNIFGNWVLNVAYAWTILGKNWLCWVQRLTGFHEIQSRLKKGIPVVVSVKGPLPGSALPYSHGHLLVIKGYQHKDKKVLCMDPAFSEDELTNVTYELNDFLEAWARRGCIAYIFEDIQLSSSLSSQ